MKRFLIIVGIMLTTASLSILSCKSRKSEPISGNVFTAETVAIANGEIVYMAKCQRCHPAGEGGLGPAINPNPAPSFIKRFQVRHGLGTMPSFKKDEISKKDLHDITKYLKAWKRYNSQKTN